MHKNVDLNAVKPDFGKGRTTTRRLHSVHQHILREDVLSQTDRMAPTGPRLCCYGELPRDVRTAHRLGGPIIRSMWVSKFPSIRLSRYRPKKRKCWSQISLAPMGEKHLAALPCDWHFLAKYNCPCGLLEA